MFHHVSPNITIAIEESHTHTHTIHPRCDLEAMTSFTELLNRSKPLPEPEVLAEAPATAS